jgi:amino acid adenylation domain-containing protein
MLTSKTAGPGEAPLSHEQRQLATGLDRICVMVNLHQGKPDAEALRRSLAAFIQRHEIWRTTFRPGGGPDAGGLVPVVQPQAQFAWSVLDLSGQPDAGQRARRRAQTEAEPPFDLARGPLVRALLVRLEPGQHRLFLTVPRIIAGWDSLTRVFLPELQALYGAEVLRRPAELAPVDRQYADYARGQRDGDDGERAVHLKFWTEYLAGAPTVLDLPADHRRPEQPGTGAGVHSFALGPELTAGLKELSEQQLVPLRVTLTAAFSALLSRYTGQEDLLIGTVSDQPPGLPFRPMLGCFRNTVVHRADLTGRPSVTELLRRTQVAGQERLPHAGVPFDAMVAELQPDRTPGGPALVQAALAVSTVLPSSREAWTATRVDLDAQASPFDLLVEVEERADGLAGRFVYHPGLFEPDTVRRMAGHWRMLLEAMVAGPGRPVSQLELLSEPERHQLLGQWSEGGTVPPGADIGELIEAQARARPDAVAVVCGEVLLNYAELHDRASDLARYLRWRGVGPDVAVGVSLERSEQLVIALLAILRAGGVYVPLDPAAPAERIRYVARDTGMPLLLSQERLRPRLAEAGPEVVALDAGQTGAGQPPLEQVVRDDGDRQPAYIIYTSGSTGQPKGVVVERGALSAHCRAMAEVYGLSPRDRVLQFSQFSFDASLEQILPTLAAGARLVMRGEELWSPRQLLEQVQRQQVTVLNLPSAYWQQAMGEWAQTPDALAGTRLRLVIAGGERLGRPGLRQWPRLGLAGTRLLNAYGPTETTITATLAEIRTDDEWITIGRPLPGRTAYILDRHGRPVPAGVVGELYVGGALLARGYLNQPGLTDERFGPDPHAGEPAARMYRTGDRARFRADGRIEYMGRADQQVKIRGYRIEPGEVEAALAQYPGVAEAVVVARASAHGPELAAFVVPRAGTRLDQAGQARLRQFLGDRLPAYMVPAVIEPQADLPRLATGKPDRRRLPQAPGAAARASGGHVAPRRPVHRQLARMWEELLGVDSIGITDNFFDLGGHSLLAAQLVDRIDQGYGTKLTVSALFARPTIEQLAQELPDRGQPGEGQPGEDEPEQEQTPASRVVLRPVQPGGTRTPFFFLHGDWTGGAFYCYALARACGDDQPFYVLEPYVFSDTEPVPAMADVAAAHLQALRSVQPQGPYRLGGFCNGGLLAYEMARQLERQGERVEFLGLVNPVSPAQRGPRQVLADRLSQALRVPAPAQVTAYLRSRHALRHVYRRLRPAGARVEDFGKLLVIEPRLAEMFPPRAALYRDYVGGFNWLAGRYRTGRLNGTVTFYWAREIPDSAQTWRPLLTPGGWVRHQDRTIEGDLMTSVTDHVEGLARQLSNDLEKVGQDSNPIPTLAPN